MSTISSSAYYNVNSSSSANGGMAGLMSGVDTDEMVEQMLSFTQAKIDAKYGEQAQLEWKQEIYRNVISSINDFSSKYFDTSYGSTLSTNLSSSSFFDQMFSTVTGGSAVSVVSTSSSASLTETYNIAVKQLASSSTLSTGHKLSGDNAIEGTALTDEQLEAFNQSANLALEVDVNGAKTTVNVDLKGTSSMSDVTSKINSALKLEFGDDTDIKVTNSSTGLTITSDSNTTVTIDRDNSDDLGVQYSGFTTTNTLSENGDSSNTITGGSGDFDTDTLSFTLTFDGVSQLITLNNVNDDDGDGKISESEVLTALQSQVSKAFGGYIGVDFNDGEGSGFKFYVDMGDEAGHEIKITGTNATELGFTPGASSTFDTTQTLEQLGIASDSDDKVSFSINGVDFSFSADTTVSSMMNTINNSDANVKISYSSLSDSMKIEATSTGSKYGIDIDDDSGLFNYFFGDPEIEVEFDRFDDVTGEPIFTETITTYADKIVDGTDALLEINGIETSRSSNTFTIEGMTLSVDSLSDFTENEDGSIDYDYTIINNSRDEDAIVDGIKSFIEDYNSLIAELNALVGADSSYKDYPPLSDAQKKEMTETEINLWEEKAKEGLVKNDIYIDSFLSQMRTAMYTSGGNSGLALYQLGIETTSDYNDKGKLQFDEATFRSALSTNAEDIKDMFTNSTSGLSANFESIIKAAANTSSGSPGTLVQEAGVSGTSTESNNAIYRSLQSISSKIESLQLQYNLEKDRYWSQFTAMETAMNNYNMQSSIFATY